MIWHTRRSHPTRALTMAGHLRLGGLLAIGIVALAPPFAHAQSCAVPAGASSCLRLELAESHRHTLGELDLTVTGQAPAGAANGTTPLFASQLNLTGLDGRLRYELRYAFDTGDILRAPADEAARLHTLAAEQREQRWGLRLATIGGHPAVLEHRLTTQQRWTVHGVRLQGEESTELRWQSPRADIELHMRAPRADQVDGATGLRCDTSASMTLKPGAEGRSVRLRAKGCKLPASAGEGVGSDGAASALELSYRREDTVGSDTIRLEQLAARPIGAPRATHTYRFQWQHQRRLGAWRTAAQASLRHQQGAAATDPTLRATDSALQWAANASIARELNGGTAFARWSSSSAAAPLYAPPAVGRTDRLHLGVDLSRWLVERMPRAAPSLVMQWQGSVSSTPDRPRDHDQRMDIKVAMRW
ncbi:MAG: hypothetical protein AAF184_02545 [Pseudomonadota bacterium]